jgi:predicted anti-sigma-YlaC factor YlaD
MFFEHYRFKKLMLKKNHENLQPRREYWLKNHLKKCPDCRKWALDLAAFEHQQDYKNPLTDQEKEQIIKSTLNLIKPQPLRSKQPVLISRHFVPALGFTIFLLILTVLLNLPVKTTSPGLKEISAVSKNDASGILTLNFEINPQISATATCTPVLNEKNPFSENENGLVPKSDLLEPLD